MRVLAFRLLVGGCVGVFMLSILSLVSVSRAKINIIPLVSEICFSASSMFISIVVVVVSFKMKARRRPTSRGPSSALNSFAEQFSFAKTQGVSWPRVCVWRERCDR